MEIVKVKSSVMIYALIIMLLVTVIIGAIIYISYFNYLQKRNYQIGNKLKHNVNSGLAILLSNNLVDYQISYNVSLYEEDFDSVYLSRELFGMFDLIRSRSSWKNISREKVAFAGGYFYKSENTTALYLADRNSPLCLVGKTELIGDCYLPQRGLKPGYIDGRSFEEKELITGEIKTSDFILPAIREDFNINLFENIKTRFLESGQYEIMNIEDIEEDRLTHSFYDKSKVIYDSKSLFLNQTKLENKIVLIAEKEIVVSKEAELTDVLLYAPNIYIESGFKGSIQCFASDTLIVGEDVQLNFPSALCLFDDNTNGNEKLFLIQSGSQINGMVFINYPVKQFANSNLLAIEKDVLINGIGYSNNPIAFQGKVYGSLYAEGFFVKKLSGTYINHLLDVEINSKKLPNWFVGPSLFSDKQTYKIMKWLN